jgi:branched-chain amino acid transport system substrate-binding protein
VDRRQLLKIIGGLAIAGTAGSTAACTSEPQGNNVEQPSGRTITIGLIAPAVGPYGAIGAEITKGFKLFLADNDNLAATNTVNPVTVEEGATPESAAAAAKQLIEKSNPMVIAGVANPDALAAVAAVAEEKKVPLVGTAASPTTYKQDFKQAFRVGYQEGEAGRSMAVYAIEQGKKAYVMRDTSEAGRAEADAFAAEFQNRGGTVVIGADSGSFANRVNTARTQGANSIFASFAGDEAAQLLRGYRQVNPGKLLPLLGPFSLTETVDLAGLGGLPDNVFTAGFYAPDLDNEVNRRFVSSYHKANGAQPSTYAMVGYEAISVIDKILRLVKGDLSDANIVAAGDLLGRIESPRGTWAFNIAHAPQQKWYLRHLRMDGQVPANLLHADLSVQS